MNKIQISNNKTLKLINTLSLEVELNQNFDLGTTVVKMDNYLKSKGAMPIGPLIQRTVYSINEDQQLEIHAYLIRQTNNFIHNIEAPYKMEPVIRVRNCMYAHYVGPEEKLKLAYDKINVTAFEEDITVANENYTIFIEKQDDNIVADIFVEKKSDD